MQNQGYVPHQPSNPPGLICPQCRGRNVQVQFLQTSAKTSTKGKGCLFGIVRGMLIICTMGLWLLLGKKKAKSKTTYTNQKMGVCQDCGNSWAI